MTGTSHRDWGLSAAPLAEDAAAPDLSHSLVATEGGAVSARARNGVSCSWAGQNCSVLFTDIASFGDPGRDDDDRRVVRGVMYRTLRDAFEMSDVPWDDCHREDRGDGALAIVPPFVPTVALVDPLLARMAAALRRHNRRASDAVRVQLRVALHVGPVVPDSEGVSGHAVNYTARLLEAPVLKERLAETAADLGFITSEFVYDHVVRHTRGHVEPAAYQRVEFQVKESEISAWMFLAGPSAEPARHPGPAPRPAAAPVAGIAFNGAVHVEGDLVLGDKLEGGAVSETSHNRTRKAYAAGL